jgi:hypothetical protein
LQEGSLLRLSLLLLLLVVVLMRPVADWEEARCLKLLRLVHSRLPVGEGDIDYTNGFYVSFRCSMYVAYSVACSWCGWFTAGCQ